MSWRVLYLYWSAVNGRGNFNCAMNDVIFLVLFIMNVDGPSRNNSSVYIGLAESLILKRMLSAP